MTDTWLEHFVMTTGVHFPVVRDFEFVETFQHLSPAGGADVLPQQFLIDARNMELVYAEAGVADVDWDLVDVLLEAP